MKGYLLKHGDDYVAYELDGLKLTYTFSDDLRTHLVDELRSVDALNDLKNELENEYQCGGLESVCMTVWSLDFHERYFKNDRGCIHHDIRHRDEIGDYLEEASDKVWLMRHCDIANKTPIHEVSRSNMNRILNTYNDVPNIGYDTWECGYWNGIMGALRWVLGEEKDWLDT